MALVKCRECGEEVSTKAKTCPNCGIKTPGLSAKGGCLVFLGLCFIVAIGMMLFGNPEPVNKAKERLTLMYMDRKIYSPVSCDAQKINENYYIRCTPADSGVPGGLYLIKIYNDDRYQIFTVNGKAGQHTNGRFPKTTENLDAQSILKEF